ncbi:MAG: NADH-quinone oxidoreductase subunit L [Bacteroidetes bacterium]|nr:NADH-quinone oxidoreductase subunit L [Bacteroidota bacterium]
MHEAVNKAPEYFWLIPLLPFASFLFISMVLIPAKAKLLSGWVTIAAVFGSFLLAVYSFIFIQPGGEGARFDSTFSWFTVGNAHVEFGLTIDPLGSIVLILVTMVSLLVQIYSQGYMEDETPRNYGRYYAFMSLFTTAMIGLVLANNFVQLYIFWELVGLCSYLLIGFWFTRPAAAAAAKKAFIVTRLGDLGFLVGILLVFLNTGSLSFAGAEAKMATLGAGTVTAIAVLLFCGAIGKSAQFPLHVWLPDAMEGPTPVSALIHAATMVAAGVYMVARLFPIFEQSKDAMLVVAVIGGFTALLASVIGLVVYDIKRVMAYSTIAQLGYAMLGLGAGGLGVGIFHLFNHGFFKALLFLTAGSAHHSTHTFDMRFMGGLRKYMPITYTTIVIAALSLSGIFPLSGFWSKDEILAQTFHQPGAPYQVLFWVAVVVAFMTAFYSFRMIFMTFHGEYKGGAEAEAGHAPVHGEGHGPHLHESPLVMTGPLMILAVMSVVSGFTLQNNGFFARFMGEHPEPMDMFVAGLSTVVALLGIFGAWAVYEAKWVSAESIGRAFGPLYNFVFNKYYMDVLYENIISAGVIVGVGKLLDLFDMRVVDGIVDGVGQSIRGASGYLRRTETGQLQTYALAIFAGAVIIVAYLALVPKG